MLIDQSGAWTHPERWLAAAIAPDWHSTWYSATRRADYLSDQGRLFFNSTDALVPEDTNGTTDVYEYEPSGVGGCSGRGATYSEASGGCVSLITSGQAGSESTFLDASESGNDVFFITAAKLVAADYDSAFDVYDAHVCTAELPCEAAVTTPPECTSGDSCKAAPSPQPEGFGATPSQTFNGKGNVVAAKAPPKSPRAAGCAKNRVRRAGKCVKKKRARRNRSRRRGLRTATKTARGR
jgi:hypothetical protein